MSNRGASESPRTKLHGTRGDLLYGDVKPAGEYTSFSDTYQAYTGAVAKHLYAGIRRRININSEVPDPDTLVPPTARLLAKIFRGNAHFLITAVERDFPTIETRLLPATALERMQRHYYNLARTNPQGVEEWERRVAAVNNDDRQLYPELDLAEAVQQQAERATYREGAIGRLSNAFQTYGGMAILLEQRASEEWQARAINE